MENTIRETLSKILNELKGGKNYPHYALVLVAFGAIAARMSGVIPDSWLVGVILAIVTLLLTKVIGISWQMENMKQPADHDGLHICQDWHAESVSHALLSAKRSIIMIQSWFPDAANLADLVKKLATDCNQSPLIVKVYMLDPESPFGAYRHAQLEQLDTNSDMKQANREYKKLFEQSKNYFTKRLKDVDGLTFSVHTYAALPTVKVYVIDEHEYVYGWLGADGSSTSNVCFRFSDSSSPELQLVGKQLQAHIDAISKISHQDWPPPDDAQPG